MGKYIYGFGRLKNYLEKHNYVFQQRKNFVVIEKKDFTSEEKKGNIFYEENGIYLEINGVKHLGYLSMKDYDITGHNKFPRFHTVECITIKQSKEMGYFDRKYDFYNTKNVDILDRQTKVIHRGVDLELCYNCIKQTKNQIYTTTTGFHEELIKYNLKLDQGGIKLDSSGRPLDWNRMAKLYKVYKNYQCENCKYDGLILKGLNKRFIEVDHIIAWELSNLNENNLKCLCVLCHSQKDTFHQEKYSKGTNLKKVKEFARRFEKELIECGNPYLKDWIGNYKK
jgi:hypothetical protein